MEKKMKKGDKVLWLDDPSAKVVTIKERVPNAHNEFYTIEEYPINLEPHEFISFEQLLRMFGMDPKEVKKAMVFRELATKQLNYTKAMLAEYHYHIPEDEQNIEYVHALEGVIGHLESLVITTKKLTG